MTAVLAPVSETSAAEFARVTSVTYLGQVHGILAALARMRPRDRGVIVQVGSALAYRSIPLQATYCAAKHAVKGFTESLRCELLHDGSQVRITMVNLPGLNTPQFDLVKTTLPNHPRPVAPVYQPEVAAKAVVWAAEHPRREVMVGAPTPLTVWAGRLAPGLVDRYLARTNYQGQQTDEPIPPDRPSYLWEPVPGDHGAHGDFDAEAHTSSLQLAMTTHRPADRGGAGRRGRGIAGLVVAPAVTERAGAHPVAAHRLLGSGRSLALVTPWGEVDWWCAPEPDSPPLLWSLLDADGACARWVDAAMVSVEGPPAGPAVDGVVRVGERRVRCRDGLVEVDGVTCLVRLVRSEDGRCRAAPSGLGRRVRPPVGGSGGRRLRSRRRQGPRRRLRGIPGGRGRARDHCGRCPRPLDGPGPVPGAGRARRLRRRRGRPRPGDRQGPSPAPAGPAPPPPPTAGCRRPGRARRLHLPADGGGGGRGHHVGAGGTRPRPAVRLPLLLAAGRGAGRLGGVPARPAGGGRSLPRLRPPGGGHPRRPPAPGGRRPGRRRAAGAGGRGGRGMGGQPAGAGGQRRRGAGAVRRVGPAGRGGVGPPADGRRPRRRHMVAGAVPGRRGRSRALGRPTSGIWELRTPRDLVSADIGRWLVLDRAVWIARGWRPTAPRAHWKRARAEVRRRVLGASTATAVCPRPTATNVVPTRRRSWPWSSGC